MKNTTQVILKDIVLQVGILFSLERVTAPSVVTLPSEFLKGSIQSIEAKHGGNIQILPPYTPRVLLDSLVWMHMPGGDCSSFNYASNDLWHVLASTGQRICTSNLHPNDINAFVACRLIPLDECSGVRPIGVG